MVQRARWRSLVIAAADVQDEAGIIRENTVNLSCKWQEPFDVAVFWSYAYAGGGPTPTTVRLMRFPVSGGSPEQILETRFPDPTNFECPIRLAGSCVLSRSEQGLTFFYELDPVRGQGKELARINMGPGNVPMWAVSPEGSRLAIVSRVQPPQQVRIVDFRNGTEHHFELPQGWYIRGLGWAADGNALLATVQSTESVIAR